MRTPEPHAPEPHAFDWRHRRGLAFAELLEHLPTDHLHHKTAATVVVTLDHHTLTGALKTAGLDTADTISAGEARRLACGAGSSPPSSAPPPSPSTSAARPDSSPRPNASPPDSSTTPAPRKDAIAPTPGPSSTTANPGHTADSTDLDNAVPLCHWHHQRIHDHTYQHTWQPDGTVNFQRRTRRRT